MENWKKEKDEYTEKKEKEQNSSKVRESSEKLVSRIKSGKKLISHKI